ncbi:MAG: DUF402 domain-containing protein [Thermomicrobium sp.]|nr:DUF402 domain-containing protein [Thermomicrobium sp.]MDW8058560.1 DUF402 domain-containing protein [Thermomicrobium sp.]
MTAEPLRDLTIVKLDPSGRIVARYRGTPRPGRPGWIVVEAVWELRTIDVGALRFEPGDRLVEYFSLVEPINAFALYADSGTFKGWYANVACPAVLVNDELLWRDLYIDVVADPTGRYHVLDEDELEASGLETDDPEGYACIVAARDHLIAALRSRTYPFDQHPSRVAVESSAGAVQ